MCVCSYKLIKITNGFPIKTILTCDTGLLFLSLKGKPPSLSTLPRRLPPPTLLATVLLRLLDAVLAIILCQYLKIVFPIRVCPSTININCKLSLKEMCAEKMFRPIIGQLSHILLSNRMKNNQGQHIQHREHCS